MSASWRAIPEVPGACVVRIDDAVECARLLVPGYLLLVPLRSPISPGRYRVRGQDVAAAPGRTQLREPGDVHLTLDRRSASLRVLWLPAAYVESVARGLGWTGPPRWRARAVDDPALFTAQLQLHAGLERGAGFDASAPLRAVVAAAVDRDADPRPPAPHLRRELAAVRDHLQGNFAAAVSLDDLAAIAGLSKYHLARSFREAFGVPPHAYQILARVNAARALLDAGAPIAEASAKVGFADQAHLTRHFKRAFSVTPGQYLRDLCPP